MATQYIQMNVDFKAPLETMFSILTDHESLGPILGAKIKRIKDGKEHINGVGSVRRVTPLPLASFEETVIKFEPNKLMEYTISKGSPMKNHLGRMVFSEKEGRTYLHYTIQFDSKIPFLGFLIKLGLENSILSGLRKLAQNYQ